MAGVHPNFPSYAWVTATHTTRITDTVAWHPHDYNWAGYSALDLVTEATQHLTRAILNLTTTEDNNAAQSQPIHDITHKLADDMQTLVQLYPVIKDAPVAPPTTPPRPRRTPTPPTLSVESHRNQRVRTLARVDEPSAESSAPQPNRPQLHADSCDDQLHVRPVATPPRRSTRLRTQAVNQANQIIQRATHWHNAPATILTPVVPHFMSPMQPLSSAIPPWTWT